MPIQLRPTATHVLADLAATADNDGAKLECLAKWAPLFSAFQGRDKITFEDLSVWQERLERETEVTPELFAFRAVQDLDAQIGLEHARIPLKKLQSLFQAKQKQAEAKFGFRFAGDDVRDPNGIEETLRQRVDEYGFVLATNALCTYLARTSDKAGLPAYRDDTVGALRNCFPSVDEARQELEVKVADHAREMFDSAFETYYVMGRVAVQQILDLEALKDEEFDSVVIEKLATFPGIAQLIDAPDWELEDLEELEIAVNQYSEFVASLNEVKYLARAVQMKEEAALLFRDAFPVVGGSPNATDTEMLQLAASLAREIEIIAPLAGRDGIHATKVPPFGI